MDVLPTNATTSSQAGLDPMAQWLATNFQDKVDVSELTSLLLSQIDPTLVPCGNDVVVLTKSSTVAVNDACPSTWTAVSCTCVTHPAGSTEWAFRVKPAAKTPRDTVVAPTVDATVSVIEVSTIGQFVLPSNITTFRLLGVTTDRTPLVFSFDLGSIFPSDHSISLVTTATKSTVAEVEIADIDFSPVAISNTFLPPSVTRVTMRNCGLVTLPSPLIFIQWSKLTNVDLSHNKLTKWYGADLADAMPDTECTITSLNLAGNAFTSIPPSLTQMQMLQTLNFSYNPVTNFTITSALYDQLGKLPTFSLDGLDSSSVTAETCSATAKGSTLKSLQGVNFCVVSAASDAATSAGSETSSSHTVLYIAIGGGIAIVAVVAALFVFFKRRSRGRHMARTKAMSHTFDNNQNDSRSEHYRGLEALPARDSLSLSSHEPAPMPVIDERLLNDPMIITSRLDQRDIRLGELLKRGGFGVVYSGVYRRRRVAIKMLRTDMVYDAKLIESFVKEIALMASLKHPRVVEYIGCVWDTIQNIAMVIEFMDRGDLREVLQFYKNRHSPLTWVSHKTQLALQIAEGLQYLHTLNPKVIHRDLKSKNVLINHELNAKLTDFGISREGRFEQTHMTAGIGTSFWIAPEVLAGLRYDERADIFSFGVVLSEIDTDDYPYWNHEMGNGQSNGDLGVDIILRKVLGGELKPRFSADCPQMIRALADRCLATEPSMRVSASEIVQYLAPIANATVELRERLLQLTV